ncbi:MAG: hypothetical protein WCT23_06025 [Candidatus Neomarinimicrobiota bacterium]|jgi:hypothetical protein
MATKKISLSIFCLLLLSFAVGMTDLNSVWFPAETPYLLEIEEKLQEHNYILQSDSLKAEYKGDLLFYMLSKDSIRCEIQLTKGEAASFVLDSFNKEPETGKNVKDNILKFSIWMLILNALTAILFFARST